MKKNIMFTVYEKNKRITLIILAFFCLCLISFSCVELTNNKVFSLHLSKNTNNQTIVFIPNSFLEKIIKTSILHENQQVYDATTFDFLSLEHKNTNGNKKIFTLALIRKNNAKDLALSGKDLDLAVNKYYAKENIEYKNIIIENIGMTLKLITTNFNSQPLILKKFDFKTVILTLKDTNLNISQKDLKSILYSSGGITANFSSVSEANLKDYIKYIESRSEYQNLGVSIIFPLSFLSNVTNNSKIYFYSDNPLLSGTYIKKMNVSSIPNGQIKGYFEIDNDNPFIFPTILKGQCNLTKDQNRVVSFEEFSYSSENLSSSEILRMNSLVKLCQDSVVPKLINKRLVPTVDNSILTIDLEGKKTHQLLENAFINYYKENIIYKINFKNE